MASPSQHHPSPLLFFETVNGYQRSAAIKAAVELDLFTAIAEGAHTPAEIAKKINAAERGVRILADFLTPIGFLNKNGNRYELTPDTEMFLSRTSRAYVGGAIRFLLHPELTRGWDLLTEAVRRGGTAISDEGHTAAEDPLWVDFARAMAPLMMGNAQALAALLLPNGDQPPMKVLDIAAGHGVYGITLAQKNPNAQVYALDWKNVLEVAKENAQHAGLDGRFHTLPGSAFERDFGSDYDVVLFTNFLHHFDAKTNEQLLRKAHGATKPGGRAVILDFVPNDDRVTPPPAGMFALTMLAATPKGDTYTFADLSHLLVTAGFREPQQHPIPNTPWSLVVGTK
jgi:ubiquinone/menaquinone biosynthesis C-methylase UbiE